MDAGFLVDKMRHLFLTRYGLYRALYGTHAAAGTLLGVDYIGKQLLAAMGRTFFIVDMRLVLVPEILKRGKHWVWCCLP
jgi:hypothetical protein